MRGKYNTYSQQKTPTKFQSLLGLFCDRMDAVEPRPNREIRCFYDGVGVNSCSLISLMLGLYLSISSFIQA
jgi:hypothetical protein